MRWLIFTALSQNHLRFHGCVMTHFLPQCQGVALRDINDEIVHKCGITVLFLAGVQRIQYKVKLKEAPSHPGNPRVCQYQSNEFKKK